MAARAVPTCLLILSLAGCEILPQRGDTYGDQRAALWEQHGRLIVGRDARYTLERLRVDTTGVTDRHDVVLARFDFDPSDATGDEYALSIGLDLGDVRRLAANRSYPLGDSIPTHATVTCLCRPLHFDSARGSYIMQTRGMRQLAGRIDAQLYFTAWDDSTVHAMYRLKQRIHGVRP